MLCCRIIEINARKIKSGETEYVSPMKGLSQEIDDQQIDFPTYFHLLMFFIRLYR